MPRVILAVLGLLAGVLLSASTASAQQVIKLGAYDFPPYAVNTADGMGGMVADLVQAMNEAQHSYVFEVVPTSAQGRYADLAAGRFDAMAFESADWGWQGEDVVASDIFMEGSEVYVARQGDGHDQSFFDAIGERSIAATWGWHYGFAGFNADPAWLHRNFTIEQPLYPGTSLYYVLEGRVDLAVVPELFLRGFLKQHPEFQDRFLVGDRPDQIYHLTFLVRRDGPLPVADVNAILAGLAAGGALDRIVAAYRM